MLIKYNKATRRYSRWGTGIQRWGSQRGSISLFLIILVGVAIMAAVWFFKPKPALRAKVDASPPVVDVVLAKPGQYRATITSQGTVVPKRQINLVNEVAGRIIKVLPNFEEGHFFKKDEVLLQLDDRDYRNAVAIADTQIAIAQRDLDLERGQARQAKRVWRDLGSKAANALSLREPQLNAAKAGLRSAQAERSRALLDVEKTSISVPFDGRIDVTSVALGEFVAAGTTLATVYDSHLVEVRLPLNNQQLGLTGFIPGEKVTKQQLGDEPKVVLSAIIGDKSYSWQATSVRMDASIDSTTRFYHLTADIKNPFDKTLFEQPLLVGLFVSANIEGRVYQDVIRLPQKALVNDKQVYVVGDDNRLSLRSVRIIDKRDNMAIVESSIGLGEKIVVSDPRVLKDGLQVSTNELRNLTADKKDLPLDRTKKTVSLDTMAKSSNN